ncbi:BCCT family transporter [Alkalihalobacillus sp. BA299]|uniref:BCCT family transporter n=1 Tax=Alkalihalobacillus sp. BA299 TaxID=2815938 RepID=UPI001ADA7D10|nr:BCCT family transporter [Alkalihalobacillus sp. BA299]
MKQPKIDKVIFWTGLIMICAISLPILFTPEKTTEIFSIALGFITGEFGWLYLWGTVIVFGLLGWLAFGKYANIKFGSANDQPEFSFPSYLAMLFTAGIGIGLMYWGPIEWAYNYISPPFGMEPRSVEAGDWANAYPMFHWGFTAWAIYCLPALPLAYALHVRKQSTLRISNACRGVIGKHADGLVGKVIDVFFMFGLVGAVGTSLGLGSPLIAEGVSQLLNIERTLTLDIIIVLCWTTLFGTSVFLGLKKGIKRLSNINTYLFIALSLFVIIFGPTVFIISAFTESVGIVLQNFVRMSFYTDSIGQSGFPQGWTIFYWAWWVAYAPFMGVFVAKISKGRTIRQVILAQCIGGTLGCWAAFAILGNTSIYFEINEIVPVVNILNEAGAPAAIISVISALPLGTFVLPVFIVLGFIFLATTIDSSAFALASVASKELHPDQEPARWHRFFWALVLATVAISLLYGGGLSTLQTLSVITSFPVVFILILMTVSFIKWIKEDEINHANTQKEKLNKKVG